jgi:DNA-binding HxlR family transcriptional regulator
MARATDARPLRRASRRFAPVRSDAENLTSERKALLPSRSEESFWGNDVPACGLAQQQGVIERDMSRMPHGGDRVWQVTLLLIRDLAAGKSRFCELERSLGGISPRTLSLRLRALEAEGIVDRRTYPEVPPRVEYRLTAKGDALVPLVEQMRAYGRTWLEPVAEAPADLAGVTPAVAEETEIAFRAA